MVEWREEYEEPDEIPEEYIEEVEEDAEEVPEKITLEEEGIEKKWWNEKIEEIDNREVQKKEIEVAKEIIEEEKELEFQRETGEISESRYEYETQVVLDRKKLAFGTRCDLESVDMTFDDLGELAEDVGDVHSEAANDRRPVEFKETVKKSIEILGPDFVEDLKEEKVKKGELPEEIDERVSRQLRMYKRKHNII